MIANRMHFIVLILLAFASPLPAADANAEIAKTAKAVFQSIQHETLPNGLNVYLLPMPGSPVVTTMVAYKVGSGDEEKDQTGLSHYLEHLLFKGTDKLVPGDVDRLTQRNGGSNNAFTSEDMTAYHFDFAADRWTIALDIEADRMRNTRIDDKHEFQQEKGAVIAELKRNEDGPWDLENKTILPLLYPRLNPYSHPVIGEESHVRGATAEIIKRHYDKWYHPNNANLVIVGGFDPKEAMKLIRQKFGSIPKGELPARKAAPLHPARTKQVRKELESKFDVPRVMLGFNTCKGGDPDDYVLDVIEDLLSRGRTCRLHRRLVDGEHLANEIGASNSAGRFPGWFSIQAELLKGKDRKKVEAAIFEELKKLASEPVDEKELARIRRGLLASYIFTNESVHSLANAIAQTVTIHDLDHLNVYLDRILAVTPADIQRVAKKYFAPESAVVVWTLPEDEKKVSSIASPSQRIKSRMLQRLDTPGAGQFTLKDAKRVVLPNGLILVMMENHRLPIVNLTAAVKDIRLQEPAEKNGVASLMGEMLEEGTQTYTADQIATLIEDTGGAIAMSSSGGSLKVLTPDTAIGTKLLFDCLLHPTFPAENFEAKQQQLLATIADSDTQPNHRANLRFLAQVYGEHPYGRPSHGKKEIVSELTAKDCQQFHQKTFVPNKTIVVAVGDFDSKILTEQITELTKDWKAKPLEEPKLPEPPTRKKVVETILTDPTAAQTHVYIGHLGIRRVDPDYYRLLVMDYVLGTGTGFTDRLSATLRDRQGLAYTVNASITGSAGEQPGTFVGYIGTFADKYTWVRDGFLKEISRIRDEPATAQEVKDAKQYLLGSLPFRLTTTRAIAAELLEVERYGLGYDVLDKYREAVSAVTVADIQAVAKKHLDPKKLVIVAVGPIKKDGKPLPQEKEKKDPSP